jgi:hypothetical protein
MVTAISTELLGQQLRVARELYQEAVRTRALVAEESLGLQLCGFGSEADRESLRAWSSAFRAAMPTKGHRELVATAQALELELEGNLVGAVLVIGRLLVAQRRLEMSEADESAADLGAKPTPEALRAVLQGWIIRGAAWGGPILGQMRDLSERIRSTVRIERLLALRAARHTDEAVPLLRALVAEALPGAMPKLDEAIVEACAYSAPEARREYLHRVLGAMAYALDNGNVRTALLAIRSMLADTPELLAAPATRRSA